jgi:autotransporter passenger strand-loop-strand repeat protein
LNGGTMWDNAGGTASNTVVNSGGDEIVYAGSTAVNTLVNSGGIVTDSSGTVTQSEIASGGFQGIWGHESGSIIYAGGEQALYNGGVATGDTLLGGVEFIRAGGTASNETIATGTLTVAGGSLTGGVTFNGSGQLTLDADTLGATIKGFAATDQIDLAGLGFSAGAKETFAGSTLTVASGANHVALSFAGSYTNADFAVSNDGAGGTLVKFV